MPSVAHEPASVCSEPVPSEGAGPVGELKWRASCGGRQEAPPLNASEPGEIRSHENARRPGEADVPGKASTAPAGGDQDGARKAGTSFVTAKQGRLACRWWALLRNGLAITLMLIQV